MAGAADGLGYQTRALSRALAILDLFGEETRVLSVKDMHARPGIPKPTIVRLASLPDSLTFLRGLERASELSCAGSLRLMIRRPFAL